MKNNNYLTIVTNQTTTTTRYEYGHEKDITSYRKYTVNGVTTLDKLMVINVAGEPFLILNREKNLWIPLSTVIKAYSGSHKTDEERAKNAAF
ncbi:MAG: hypothetical protein ACLRX6_03495 [Limosilactobacillus pontis]|uniref:hypothetical protein n=1 Tax=Limosilactobacillus pontis TaxID=35787 RepID=UPI0039A21498